MPTKVAPADRLVLYWTLVIVSLSRSANRLSTVMSPMQGGSSQASQHASSSSNPLGSSEIRSSPAPLPPNHRRDINAIKQELQDVLGDQGLPYWTALGDYLEYRLRHDEFLGMVKKWLGRDGASAAQKKRAPLICSAITQPIDRCVTVECCDTVSVCPIPGVVKYEKEETARS